MINTTAKREAFISLKDHKPNFANNPFFALSTQLSLRLERSANSALKLSKLKLNQWKNTKAVLAWFTGIQHKELDSFIAFDVVEFYPSISIDLLGAALEFAWKRVTICDDKRHIILQANSFLLHNSGEPWSKKTSSNVFDVTMGSYDGAESCELVGTYLFHKIKKGLVTHVTLACTEMTV